MASTMSGRESGKSAASIRHTTMKFQNARSEKKILMVFREEKQIRYKGSRNQKMPSDFSIATLEARREGAMLSES